MFERLRQSMVESFVGAIALGWLFAEGIMHFAYVFVAPVTGWFARKEFLDLSHGGALPASLVLHYALPELVKSFGLLLLWYILMRWLYFKPLKKETPEPKPNPEQTT